MAQEFGLGALPPPGHEWENGKTAASIDFVNKATAILNKGVPWPGCTKESVDKLITMVNQVKGGEQVLTEWVNMKNLLKQL